MPCLTADALTTDPEGMAFLRDVLAQPASATAVSARRPAVAARRRVRRQESASPPSLRLLPHRRKSLHSADGGLPNARGG